MFKQRNSGNIYFANQIQQINKRLQEMLKKNNCGIDIGIIRTFTSVPKTLIISIIMISEFLRYTRCVQKVSRILCFSKIIHLFMNIYYVPFKVIATRYEGGSISACLFNETKVF